MLRAQGLRKHFGQTLAVDGLDLCFAHPSLNGLLGPNGAGKSTTLRMLVGVLRPDAGSVHAFGECLSEGASAARRHLGYLPENTPLPQSTRVDAYLDFAADLRALRGPPRLAALTRVIEQCALGACLRQRIGSLSKGTRQRVGLAQALLGEPPILVLDEPTNGLDPGEQVRMRELLRELGRRQTLIVSSHLLSEVQELATRVLILARGRLVADGSVLDLVASERAALVVTLRLESAEPEAAASVLDQMRALPGVKRAQAAGADAQGRTRFALEVEERWGSCERLAELAACQGWHLCELRPEAAGLEHVFLRRVARVQAVQPGEQAP